MTQEIVPHPRFENPKPGQEITIPGDVAKQRATDAVNAFYDVYTDQASDCTRISVDGRLGFPLTFQGVKMFTVQ